MLPPKTMLWFILLASYDITHAVIWGFCSYRPPIDSTLTHPAVIYMTACVSKVFYWQLQMIRKHIVWQTTCFPSKLLSALERFSCSNSRNFPELRKLLVCHSCLISRNLKSWYLKHIWQHLLNFHHFFHCYFWSSCFWRFLNKVVLAVFSWTNILPVTIIQRFFNVCVSENVSS